MALTIKKLAMPLSSLAFSLITACRCPASRFPFLPKARICINISPEQQYSGRQDLSEEEILSRTKFLATQFHGTEAEMYFFLTNNQQLLTMGKKKFYNVTELLAQHGIVKKELFTYPNVYRRKFETLSNRIKQLEDGGVKPVTLQMVNTTHKKYKARYERLRRDIEASEMFRNSKELLLLELGLTESVAEAILKESLWLNNTKLSTLKEKIELLKSYNISSEAIRNKIWILAFGTSTLKSHLDVLKQSGVSFQDFPRSYLVAIKSSNDIFWKIRERFLKDKAILDESGCTDKEAYICCRLSCSMTDLESMRQKFPRLLSVRLPKLKNNLDIILNEFGLLPSLVLDFPRILRFSTDTLRKRFEQQRDLKEPITASVLKLSNQQYKDHISQLHLK